MTSTSPFRKKTAERKRKIKKAIIVASALGATAVGLAGLYKLYKEADYRTRPDENEVEIEIQKRQAIEAERIRKQQEAEKSEAERLNTQRQAEAERVRKQQEAEKSEAERLNTQRQAEAERIRKQREAQAELQRKQQEEAERQIKKEEEKRRTERERLDAEELAFQSQRDRKIEAERKAEKNKKDAEEYIRVVFSKMGYNDTSDYCSTYNRMVDTDSKRCKSMHSVESEINRCIQKSNKSVDIVKIRKALSIIGCSLRKK